MSERSRPAAGGFQVAPSMWVRLGYRAFDEDGEPIESLSNEIDYVQGFGALLPALESALEGAVAGDHRAVTLSPRQAFGPRRKEAIIELDPEEFPADVQPGDRFEAETDEGMLVVLRILEVGPDVVVVDTNHPLAGQRVRFELDVQEVRPASAQELASAERALLSERPASEDIIPAERLLRGRSQRYEMAPHPTSQGTGSSPSPHGEAVDAVARAFQVRRPSS
jgi:FKBP-type peptidyl-prolyl cis-trans isomerase SlyD